MLDMHVHTIYSPCSFSRPKEIEKIAKKRGIIFAITDHDTIKSFNKFSVPFIKGVEWKTNLGEILIYFIEELPNTRDFFEVLDFIKENDYLASLSHPFYKSGVFWKREIFDIPNFIGFEINGKIPWKYNLRAINFFDTFYTAGSDAHLPRYLGQAGLIVDTEDFEEIRDGILKKRFPFFYNWSFIPFRRFLGSVLIKLRRFRK